MTFINDNPENTIREISLPNGEVYTFNAEYLDGMSLQDIKDLIDEAARQGLKLHVCTTAEDTPEGITTYVDNQPVIGALTADEANPKWMYLVKSNPGATGYEEYVVVAVDDETFEWEDLGNNDVELEPATDDTLGVVKTNSTEGIALNDNGQLTIDGRLGQTIGGGLYYPKTAEPTSVGAGALLITDGAKGISAHTRTFSIMGGAGITCRRAPAGSTVYRISNTRSNRFLCAAVAAGGSRLAIGNTVDEGAINGTVEILSVKYADGRNCIPYFGADEPDNDIIITVDRTANPDAATTKLRLYGATKGTDAIAFGQAVSGVGKTLVMGIGNCAMKDHAIAAGGRVYISEGQSYGFGRILYIPKQFCFAAGEGHDFTNASTGAAAFGKWSVIDANTAMAVGNGESQDARSNAFEVKRNGDIVVGGNVRLISPNGTKFDFSVNNDGTINGLPLDNQPTENSNKLLTSDTIYKALQEMDKEPLKVTITKTGDTYISDISSGAIVEAYYSGRNVYAILEPGDAIYPIQAEPTMNLCVFATWIRANKYRMLYIRNTEVTILDNDNITCNGGKNQNVINTTLQLNYEIDDALEAVNKQYVDTLFDNYYSKSETDALLDEKQDVLTFDTTPTEGSTNPVTSDGVARALASLVNFKPQKVTELPEVGESHILYFVTDPDNPNISDEYIWIDDEPTGYFQEIGKTEVDLSDYFTKTEINTFLAGKVDKVSGKDLSTNDYTNADKAIVDSIATDYYTKTQVDDLLDDKQDTLEYDSAPTTDSTKMVNSGVVKTALDLKVDKVSGKDLSTNDYTNAAKAKVDAIPDNPAYAVKVNGAPLTPDANHSVDILTSLLDVYTKAEVDTEIDRVYDSMYERRRSLHVLVRKNNDAGQFPMGWVAIVTPNVRETYASFCTWLYSKNYRSPETSYGLTGGCCGTIAVRNSADTGTAYVGKMTSGAYSTNGTSLCLKFDYNGTITDIPEGRCAIISFPLS